MVRLPWLRRQCIAQHLARRRVGTGVELVSLRPGKHTLHPTSETCAGFGRSLSHRQQGLQHDGAVDLLPRQGANGRAGLLDRGAPLLACYSLQRLTVSSPGTARPPAQRSCAERLRALAAAAASAPRADHAVEDQLAGPPARSRASAKLTQCSGPRPSSGRGRRLYGTPKPSPVRLILSHRPLPSRYMPTLLERLDLGGVSWLTLSCFPLSLALTPYMYWHGAEVRTGGGRNLLRLKGLRVSDGGNARGLGGHPLRSISLLHNGLRGICKVAPSFAPSLCRPLGR